MVADYEKDEGFLRKVHRVLLEVRSCYCTVFWCRAELLIR